MMSAPWWLKLDQRLRQASWSAGLGSRGFWGWFAHLWMELVLGPLLGRSGGRVQRCLWAQGGLKAACLLMAGAVSLPS